MTEENRSDIGVEEAAEIFNSVSSYNRLYTYLNLGSQKPMEICDDLDLTRSAMQYYLDDWKELQLISIEGNEYYYTSKGVEILTQLQNFVEDEN